MAARYGFAVLAAFGVTQRAGQRHGANGKVFWKFGARHGRQDSTRWYELHAKGRLVQRSLCRVSNSDFFLA